jgi:hypothetical protein
MLPMMQALFPLPHKAKGDKRDTGNYCMTSKNYLKINNPNETTPVQEL